MDKILTKAVWKMRQQDSNEKGKDVNVSLISTGGGGSYQMYIPSQGCRYACTMCNYGFGHPIRKELIVKEVEAICRKLLPNDLSNLILESSGSFLDEAEIPEDLQWKIMQMVSKTSVHRVQIETHYKTISEEKMKRIKEIFPDKEIGFELGLESTNPDVFSIYNKCMDLNELLETIWKAEKLGIETSLNLMVGVPLLTIKEQIEDAVQSINWILSNCPKSTSIVLFPLNIKDYTLVKHMYKQGRYMRVRDWEFIEVLERIPKEALNRVYISWWGNRCNEFHGEEAIIKPFHCGDCHEELMTFYKSFVESTEAIQKVELIEEISSYRCNCKEEYWKLKANEQELKLSFKERLEEEKRKLKFELNL